MTNSTRLEHLDGLRGVAALVVVVFHIISAIAPRLVRNQQMHAIWIAYSPIAVLWNGTFAVSVFFVLSGFVVTNATLQKSDPLWLDVVIRYLRLAIPATLSTLFAWFLLNIFPTEAKSLRDITGSPWLEWTFQEDIPRFSNALYSGMVGIFLNGGSYFNNVLWTMRPELIGSFFCFFVCSFERSAIRIYVSLSVAALILLSGKWQYECFIVGICLREAWATGRLPSKYPVIALLVGLLIGSQSGDGSITLLADWMPRILSLGEKDSLLPAVAAGLVVYGCLNSPPLITALSSRVGVFFGLISFPLYLTHVPLIYTIFSWLYIRFCGGSICVAALAVSFLFAIVFTSYSAAIFVEKPFLKMLGKIRRHFRAKGSKVLYSPIAK